MPFVLLPLLLLIATPRGGADVPGPPVPAVPVVQATQQLQEPASDRPTFFEADQVSVGQGEVEDLGIPPGELVDAVLPPGADGTGTAFEEPLQYQLGALYSPVGRPHPMLVAYHGFGGSAGSVATQSTLDEVCNQRGWVYLSVTGLDDKVFGTEPSQQHTEAAIRWMLDHHNVDPDRISMVGFSMGAGVAMNFAARHRDPDGIVLAALGLVAASADWTSAWEVGGTGVKAIMENALNFGAPPSLDPFGYRRWSGSFHANGSAFDIGRIQPELSMASNLGSTPVYLTWDTGDPTLFVADQCAELADYLPGLGGEVVVKKVSGTLDPDTGGPAPHSWALLKVNQFMNFLDGRTADRRPARVHALLAEDAVVGDASVNQRQAGMFSTLDLVSESGLESAQGTGAGWRLTGVANARRVDLDAGGLQADRRVLAEPSDGQSLELGLGGFQSRPSYLVSPRNGALVADVRSEPWADALVVPVPGDGLIATIVSRPDWSATLTASPDPAPVGASLRLLVDGPPSARTAWLVFGTHEELSPVFGGAAVLGLAPRAPSVLRTSTLDAEGDLELDITLPDTLPLSHLHIQALFLKAGHVPVATSNVWMLRWED